MKGNAMRSLILILCGLASAPPGAAQESAEQPAPETAPGAPESAAAEEPEAATPPPPDRFTPSEEISLDLPVSFPVDI
jgi:hypothetical protein